MNKRSGWIALVTLAFLLSPTFLWAQYTLVLKNGRRITAQSFREEGQTIKVHGIGGEIGIPRDQVQSILRAGEEGRGLDLRAAPAGEAAEPGQQGQEQAPRPGEEPGKQAGSSKEQTVAPEPTPAEQRAKEEKEYQRRVQEVTERLKAARERYSLASGGSGGSDPTLLDGGEAIRRRNEDLTSRLRDVQHNPGGPSDAGTIKMETPSPFAGQPPTTTEMRPGSVAPSVAPPPPVYSDREEELSGLRNRMSQLVKEREKLIEEMRQKNFDTGNLFLE